MHSHNLYTYCNNSGTRTTSNGGQFLIKALYSCVDVTNGRNYRNTALVPKSSRQTWSACHQLIIHDQQCYSHNSVPRRSEQNVGEEQCGFIAGSLVSAALHTCVTHVRHDSAQQATVRRRQLVYQRQHRLPTISLSCNIPVNLQ